MTLLKGFLRISSHFLNSLSYIILGRSSSLDSISPPLLILSIISMSGIDNTPFARQIWSPNSYQNSFSNTYYQPSLKTWSWACLKSRMNPFGNIKPTRSYMLNMGTYILCYSMLHDPLHPPQLHPTSHTLSMDWLDPHTNTHSLFFLRCTYMEHHTILLVLPLIGGGPLPMYGQPFLGQYPIGYSV